MGYCDVAVRGSERYRRCALELDIAIFVLCGLTFAARQMGVLKSPAGFPAGLSRFQSGFYPCSQLLQHERKRLPERKPAAHGELHIRRAVHGDGIERLRRQIREDA